MKPQSRVHAAPAVNYGRLLWSAVAATALVLSLAGQARSAPVAMAMDVQGQTEVVPFTEFESGTSIKLGPADFIDVLDYVSCEEKRIMGGVVLMTEQGVNSEGGTAIVLGPGNCPQLGEVIDETAGPSDAATTPLRHAAVEVVKADKLTLVFSSELREKLGTVMIALGDGQPKRYTVAAKLDVLLPEDMPDTVNVRVLFEPGENESDADFHKMTLDRLQSGRKTAVVFFR
ncbi:MAG: hypothetical protein ABJN26_29490 [Stappiaceae bacterium]